MRTCHRLLSLYLLSLLLVSGCINPRAQCRISVANASDEIIPLVVVRDAIGNEYMFTDLQPHSAGPDVRVKHDVGKTVVLNITSEAGASSESTVAFEQAILSTFEGRIVLQVESNATVRPFVLPRVQNPRRGGLSWTKPPSWQGGPTIPGMSIED